MLNCRRPLLLMLSLAAAAHVANAQRPWLPAIRPSAPRTLPGSLAKVDRLLVEYANIGQFNGVILVARGGRTLYTRAFGFADMELAVPNSVDTRFQIASITKTVTAMLVLRLVDRGTLRLDGTVRTYLPDYPSSSGDSITIQQLLTHTAGLQGDIADFPPNSKTFPAEVAKINGDFYSLEELVKMIAARPLLSRPGEKFNYSSDGYAVLGAICARVLGTSYEEAVAAEILRPVKMIHTGYAPQTEILPGRAHGYRRVFAGYENARPIAITPAGGLYSTVGDLARLDGALFLSAVMSPAAKALAWKETPSVTSYGWQVRVDSGAPVPGSLKVRGTGALPGFNAYFTRTADSLCVILLVNTRELTFRLDEITTSVLTIMRGRSAPRPRPSVAEQLASLLERSSIEDATRAFHQWRDAGWRGGYLNESEMNSLGYDLLLRLARPAQAIGVFSLNTEAFPSSWNAFDSLGEAQATMGDTTSAIRNYERSVALNPNSESGLQALKRLRGVRP